jgi:hypothetical protein
MYLFRPSLSFLAEAQPRLQIGEDTRHFLAKQNISSEKLQIYFVSSFFRYINLLIHINNFFL